MPSKLLRRRTSVGAARCRRIQRQANRQLIETSKQPDERNSTFEAAMPTCTLNELRSVITATVIAMLDQQRDSDGKFASGGGGGGGISAGSSVIAPHIHEKASRIARATGAVKGAAKAVVAKAKSMAVNKFKKFEVRYGHKGAVAVMSASILLTPIPIPGTSFAPILIAEGVRAVGRLFKHKAAAAAMAAEDDSPASLIEAVREYLNECYAHAGEDPPELTDDEIAAALKKHLDEPEK